CVASQFLLLNAAQSSLNFPARSASDGRDAVAIRRLRSGLGNLTYFAQRSVICDFNSSCLTDLHTGCARNCFRFLVRSPRALAMVLMHRSHGESENLKHGDRTCPTS